MALIAIDIDSTLHHYWDLLEEVAERRFGIPIPYAEQRDWGISVLERDQIIACIEETHPEQNILGAEPYPDAVEVVGRWRGDGHWIHITSHRATATRAATEAWLERIGLPYDDLYLSYDKVTRCAELGIDVLIDDSPVNIERARAEGIVAASLEHPWNRHLAGEDGVVIAPDWRALADRLAPVLAGA